ncbi:MAG: energy-coupled thiamine transporter ThiT [Clostridia bacterium]|nr:energy-coupled thiamine transporter ThiT [Clostridia bacterium]
MTNEIKKSGTHRLTFSALMLAIATVIAFICGMIPFLNFPFGGGITIGSMLPIILVSYIYGVRWGLVTGAAYSVIQMFLGHGTIAALFTPASDSYQGILNALLICFIDYILAYTALGLGGIFRNKIKNAGLSLCLGSITALALCYAFHILSGFIFYGAWAEWFFTDTVIAELGVSRWIMSSFTGNGLAFLYSTVYNGCYMIPEIIITASLSFIFAKLPMIKKI